MQLHLGHCFVRQLDHRVSFQKTIHQFDSGNAFVSHHEIASVGRQYEPVSIHTTLLLTSHVIQGFNTTWNESPSASMILM
jgi:hypothetical protein